MNYFNKNKKSKIANSRSAISAMPIGVLWAQRLKTTWKLNLSGHSTNQPPSHHHHVTTVALENVKWMFLPSRVEQNCGIISVSMQEKVRLLQWYVLPNSLRTGLFVYVKDICLVVHFHTASQQVQQITQIYLKNG